MGELCCAIVFFCFQAMAFIKLYIDMPDMSSYVSICLYCENMNMLTNYNKSSSKADLDKVLTHQ